MFTPPTPLIFVYTPPHFKFRKITLPIPFSHTASYDDCLTHTLLNEWKNKMTNKYVHEIKELMHRNNVRKLYKFFYKYSRDGV